MRGGIDSGDHRFSPRFVGVVDVWKDLFLIRGWDLIPPGWRWLYEPQVGVYTPCGAVLIRRAKVFVPGLFEGFLIRRWDLILHGWRWLMLAL